MSQSKKPINHKIYRLLKPFVFKCVGDEDIELMKQGAKLFEGAHYFKSYCFKPTENGLYNREIITCELVENTHYTANYFPEKSYILKVKGKGFMRNQIRLMMGTLVDLGKGKLTMATIKQSLEQDCFIKLEYIAPASGLILHNIEFY